MCKNRQPYFLVIFVFTIGFVPFLHAQESDISQEPGEYNIIVDEALDQIEETIDQVQNSTTPIETETSSDSKSETESDILVEVEILESIVISDNSELEEVLQTKIIPLLHAEASGIIDALDQMKSPKGEVLYNKEDSTLMLKDAPEQLEAMSTYVKEVDILLETEIFQLEYVKAQDIVKKVEDLLTKNVGQVQFNQKANSIIATDTPLKIGAIKELISSLDFLNKEIQIEAKILQIVLNDEHMMGVDWEAILSDFQNIDFSEYPFEEDLKEESSLNIGAVSREDYEILLEALDTVGIVDNISDDVYKADNKSRQTINILSPLSREAQKLNAVEEGNADHGKTVQFHLTPEISRNGKISVIVQPEYVEKGSQRHLQASKNQATIQIKNGETIVIGSLFENVMIESTWKIPLLGDLPLLGFVFRNQGEKSRKSEIITFLTIETLEKER